MSVKKLLFVLCLLSVKAYCQSPDLTVIKVPDPANPGQSIDCGKEGTAKDGTSKLSHLAWIGNPPKNRFDLPPAGSIKTTKIEDLVASNAIKSKFTAGTAVQVTGYVFSVTPGGTESCNCGTKDIGFKDTHIELTPNAKDTAAKFRMIVEVTPRMRMIMQQAGTADWTTAGLQQTILHHMVTVQGWLFYDEIHEPEAFATNPANNGSKPNWRASCWEIHPITSIEVVDVTSTEDDNNTGTVAVPAPPASGGNDHTSTPPPPPADINNNNTQNTNTMGTNTPLNTLIIILIGAILGAVGQGIRVVVGVKKVFDSASIAKVDASTILEYKQLALSIFIAFAIGAIAGVLAAITSTDANFSKSEIIAFIAAGYAGTDFIEGIMKTQTGTGITGGK